MPFCNEHNEVYRGEECPVCAESAIQSRDMESTTDDSAADVNEIVDDALDSVAGESDVGEIEGDVVIGSQDKSITKSDETALDQSETVIDESSTVVDESSNVVDSVVGSKSTIGGESDGGHKDSDNTAGDSGTGTHRKAVPDSESPPDDREQYSASPQDSRTTDTVGGEETAESKFCLYCGSEIPDRAVRCPDCGEELSM